MQNNAITTMAIVRKIAIAVPRSILTIKNKLLRLLNIKLSETNIRRAIK